MNRGVRTGMVMVVVAAGVVASTRLTLNAQDRRKPAAQLPRKVAGRLDADIAKPAQELKVESKGIDGSAAVSVQDALERPFILPFGTATRLDEVCAHLGRILRAPVVLDRAALDRLNVRPEETVELELHGVRLKTGLKLLLDQVGLTYRVVPEDNLLIITDDQGSENPLNRVHAELKALHRDLHDVRDAVDDLRTAPGIEEGAKMRKPTIIEEMPEPPAEKKEAPAAPQPRPRSG